MADLEVDMNFMDNLVSARVREIDSDLIPEEI